MWTEPLHSETKRYYFKGYLGSLPQSWRFARLKNVLSLPVTDGPHTTPMFIDSGVPFLSVDGIQDGELTFVGCRYISEADHEEFSKKARPQRDDILMGKAASTGKIARVNVDFEFSIWSPLALIRSKKHLAIPSFLEYYLKSVFAQAEIDVRCTSNTQKNISMDDIPCLALPLPPLEAQRAIVTFLSFETAKIDTLIEKQQRLVALLEEKRQAVISHAVTKGLDPSVPMKDSGIEWLGKVPEHWKISRIKYLADLISKGTTPTTIGSEFTSSGIRFLKAENIDGSQVNMEPENYISEETHSQLSRSNLRAYDVLVVIAGATTGKSAVLSPDLVPCNTNQAVSFIRPKNTKLSKIIQRWLSSSAVQSSIKLDAVQSAQPNLSMEDLGNIYIPLPPPKEQDIIENTLLEQCRQLDAIRERAARSVGLLTERRSALISAAVTGKIDVGKVCDARQDIYSTLLATDEATGDA